MKVQHAIYSSLKAFMHAIGYAQESDKKEDDPIWSTKNESSFRAMMEYVFGVAPHQIAVPTSKETIHPAMLKHPDFEYHEHLEEPEDGEEDAALAPAPAPAEPPAAAPAPVEPPAPAPAPAAPEVIEEIKQQFESEQKQEEQTDPQKADATTVVDASVAASASSSTQSSQEQPPAASQEGSSAQE